MGSCKVPFITQNNEEEILLPESISSAIDYQTSIFSLKKEILKKNGGDTYDYFTIVPKANSVIVLYKRNDGAFLVTKEYRHSVEKIVLSCPGGFIDEGETPLQAAKRELNEETGFLPDSFELMGKAYPYPGMSSLLTYFFRAVHSEGDLEQLPQKLDENELIVTFFMTKEEVKNYMNKQLPVDGHLLTALFFDSQQ